MKELKLSNFFSMVPDYLMSNDERTLLDWLIFKCSYNFDWYRHSIQQVQAETGVKRKMQNRVFAKFRDFGFLEMKNTYYNGNPYQSFYIHFRMLTTKEILGKLFRDGSETYSMMLLQFQYLAAEQQKNVKRSRSQKKAELEKESATTERVIEALREIDNVWRRRIEMYNNGELTDGKPERGKRASSLHKSKSVKSNLRILLQNYDTEDVADSFIAYADAILKGNIKTCQILPYFLKRQGIDFPVFGRYLDVYASDYSYKQ